MIAAPSGSGLMITPHTGASGEEKDHSSCTSHQALSRLREGRALVPGADHAGIAFRAHPFPLRRTYRLWYCQTLIHHLLSEEAIA